MSNSPHDPLLHEREPTWKKTVVKQIIEIEKLKSELAALRADKERLVHVFHHDGPMAKPGDIFADWLTALDSARSAKGDAT